MSIRQFFKSLGPGVITGAADDDPSGIATYSQAGAQFGFNLLWMAVWMLPFQVAIQEACARIGAVSGQGIAAVLRQYDSRKILYSVVFLVLIANIINIGADIGAMAAAAQLLIPMNGMVLALVFAILMVILEVFLSYRIYARVLKWLCLSLLAYPLTVIIVTHNWTHLLRETFIPHVSWNFQSLFIVTGVLGTTISPYLFFWQASEEAEEKASVSKRDQQPFLMTDAYIHALRRDNFFGMVFSELGTWSIMVVAAIVLHAHGIRDIQSAADAAKALEPLVDTFPHAGFLAKVIFATGIIGLGLLAVPVLSGSAAYALGEACDWKVGLDLKFNQAQGFYGVIIIATAIGVLLNLFGFNPVKALVYAAVINGVVAVPLIFVIILTARNPAIMGKYRSGIGSSVFLWLTFFGMGLAAVGMFVSWFRASVF